MNNIKELEQQVRAMQEEIIKLKKEVVHIWPEDGDDYYFIDIYGDTVNLTFNTNIHIEAHLQRVGNFFKTRDEARKYALYLLKPSTVARAKLQMYADEVNDPSLYTSRYQFIEKGYSVTVDALCSNSVRTAGVLFSSYATIHKAQKVLGSELIKKALGYYDE